MSLSQARVTVIAAVGGAIALFSGSGCSSDKTSPLMPIELFPQAYAQALCGSLQHCCDDNQVAFSDSACTAGWKAAITEFSSNPVLAANYDPKAATQCANAVREALSGSCDPIEGSITAARAVCQRVFAGKKLPGELCTDPRECAPIPDVIVGCEGLPIPDPEAGILPLSSAWKGRDPLGIGGASAAAVRPQALPTVRKCIALPEPEPGSSCATPELEMLCTKQDVRFCDRTDFVCKNRVDVGGECVVGGCRPGMSCVDGICNPGSGIGADCASAEQCNSFLRCDLGSRKCADRLRPGDSCSTDNECSIGVCDATTKRCLRNAIATTESCSGRDPGDTVRP